MKRPGFSLLASALFVYLVISILWFTGCLKAFDNALLSILGASDGDTLNPLGTWVSSALSLVIVLLVAGRVQARGALRGALLSVALALGAIAAMGVLLANGHLLPIAAPLAAVLLVGPVLAIHEATLSEKINESAEALLKTRLESISGMHSLIDADNDQIQLLNDLGAWIEQELDCEIAVVMLLDDTQRLCLEPRTEGSFVLAEPCCLDLQQGAEAHVVQTAKAVMENCLKNEQDNRPQLEKILQLTFHNMICMPLILHGNVVGVIETVNKRNGIFKEIDQTLLTVIAGQTILSLESNRGYTYLQQEVEKATEQLQVVNRELNIEKIKLEALVEEMDSGVIAVDTAGCVITWNRAASHFFGVSEETAMGRSITEIVGIERLQILMASTATLQQQGVIDELELISVDGQRFVLRIFVTTICDHEGLSGTLVLLTDITQLKELDLMKTDLISFVSHELKNPLTSIKGFAQLLQRNTEDTSPQAYLVRMVNQQVNRMQWLVEDFLDVARLDAGLTLQIQRRMIDDPASLVQGICELPGLMTTAHSYEINFAPEVTLVYADRGKLEQVLVNLLNNAVKYSPDGGKIQVNVQAQEDGLEFRVADHGIGIRPEQEVNLFRRYQRVTGSRERIKGTGIGLFLCHHLIAAHDGKIWIEQNKPQGVVFCFTLPQAEADLDFVQEATDPETTSAAENR